MQLSRYPVDLVAADSTLNEQPRHGMYKINTSSEAVTLCSCGEKRFISNRSYGPVKAEYASKIFHEPWCKIFAKRREKRRTTIKFSMRPFVNRTIELVFHSSLGVGGSSRSREIKSHRTVSRLLSPAFQKFESLNCLGWISSHKMFTDLMEKIPTVFSMATPIVRQCGFMLKQSLLCRYSDDILLAWLNDLPETLEEIFRSGEAHPTDRDEFGNTLIHVSNRGALFLFV